LVKSLGRDHQPSAAPLLTEVAKGNVDLSIRDLPGVPRRRLFSVLQGVLERQTAIIVPNPTCNNVLRAIAERIVFVKSDKGWVYPQGPETGAYKKESLLRFRKLVTRRLGTFQRQGYKATAALYSGRKFTTYDKAADSLNINPIRKDDANVKAFGKAEKLVCTDATIEISTGHVVDKGKLDPCMRIISPRDPRFILSLATFLKPIEHRIYAAMGHVIGGRDGRVIAKGRNAVEQASDIMEKFRKFKDCRVAMLDIERFDQHVSVQALTYEHGFYTSCFVGAALRELKTLLRWQLKNKLKFVVKDGIVTLTVDGARMSGDINTGMGNCIIVCALMYAFCCEYDIEMDLYNNGDDCLVFMDSKDEDIFTIGLRPWFKAKGFTMKVEGMVSTFEQIEFCQTKPVWNGMNYVMCRTYPTACSKDVVSLLPINNEKSMLNWFHDLGNCGQALCVGVPIYQEFYSMFSRWGQGAKGFNRDISTVTGMEMLADRMEVGYRSVDDRARYSFYLAFGVTPDEQVYHEQRFKTLVRPLYTSEVVLQEVLPKHVYPMP